MLYKQVTENCFQSSVGPDGLSPDAFARCLTRASDALDRLRTWAREDELPLLRLPFQRDELPAMGELANTLRDTYSHVVVLGTGGSSLGAQALVALAHPAVRERLIFCDNLDGRSFAMLMERLDMARTCFIVVSKSGGTAETLAQTLVALGAVRGAMGDDGLKVRFLVITEPADNPLRRLAARWSLSVMDHDPAIGGRFSVFSIVGILPGLIAGVDAAALRGGAAHVLEATLAAEEPGAAPAAVGACLAVAAMQQGLGASVVMPYCDGLGPFAMWYRQLWAESLGKNGSGSTPVPALGPVDQHSQLQLYLDGPADKLFTLILRDDAGTGPAIPTDLAAGDPALAYLEGRTIGDLVAAEGRATAETLIRRGRPLREFHIRRLDEATLGALMMHFMLETVIAAHLLDVDPFDQPAVEEGKILTRQYLSETAVDEGT